MPAGLDSVNNLHILVGMDTIKLQFTALAPTRRNAVKTRERLLNAAYEEIYRTGFQGSDLMSIIKRAGVTKGALYHHFGSKEGLGLAMIDAVIAPRITETWLTPLAEAEDPVAALITIVEGMPVAEADVKGGSPLNNLALEMSPLDEGFRIRLARIYNSWIAGIASALKRGKTAGKVRSDVDVFEFATGLVASYEGFVTLAKSAQDSALLSVGIRQMTQVLKGLRP